MLKVVKIGLGSSATALTHAHVCKYCRYLPHEAVSRGEDPLLVDQGASAAMHVGNGIYRGLAGGEHNKGLSLSLFSLFLSLSLPCLSLILYAH